MHILIIGYGNPLRGDDALGWRVTERLREVVHNPEIEILTLHQLAPELMDSLSRADFAVFVDAREGDDPGGIVERRIAPQPSGSAAFTHHAPPEALLDGARVLYGRAAEAVMISVTGADFSLREELSPAVSARLEDAVEVVLRRIADWQKSTP